MKIVYFGSGKFGLPALKSLKTSAHNVACVVTQPDRRSGRGLVVGQTPIKEFAKESGIRVFQPEDVNSADSLAYLKEFDADLFIVIAYGQILKDGLLAMPRILPLNVHASLLPKYRGAAPINWAIINGEKETGVTLMKMALKMDAGPLLTKRSLDILTQDTALTLEDRLSELAATLLKETLIDIEGNKFILKEQDESLVTFAPKLEKEHGRINWEKSAQELERLIRGVIDWPGAFTYYKGKLLKIYKARVITSPVSKPGVITGVSRDAITVRAGRDSLLIEELQLEGKKRMSAKEFITGQRVRVEESL